MENFITSLHAKNIGLFDNLDISFNKGFNFIVGPNSSGKTSILKCLAIALNPNDANQFRYREKSAVWFDAVFNDQNYRVGLGEDWVGTTGNYRDARVIGWKYPPSQDNIKAICAHSLAEKNANITPLFLGAYRRIAYKQITGMQREKEVTKQRQEYRSSGINNLLGGVLPDIKQWMINRYFEIEKDWAYAYKKNWEWILENLKCLAPTNCSLEFGNIKQDLEPMFRLQGSECYLEEISAGFQAILSLVFAIVEWIEGTNEEECSYIPEATGTVIIDELDVHLHPEWQLTIRSSLEKIFPKLQFIVTTHSPHLIATAKSGELIVLPELSRSICTGPIKETYAGWNTDQILEEVMSVKSLENKTYSVMLKKAMDYVKTKNMSALQQTFTELQKIVHPSNTILQILQVKLAQMELEDINSYD